MRMMIASDLHGSSFWINKMKQLFINNKCDTLLLLGDLLYHGPRNYLPDEYDTNDSIEILNSLKNQIIAVRGNCDSEVDEMVLDFDITQKTVVLDIDDKIFFATHGHIYNETYLPAYKNIDVLLNGHTHIDVFNKHKDFVFVNPGSVSIPKQNTKHSVIIYENKEFVFYNLEDYSILHKNNI